mgnify:CR=1 FL=1
MTAKDRLKSLTHMLSTALEDKEHAGKDCSLAMIVMGSPGEGGKVTYTWEMATFLKDLKEALCLEEMSQDDTMQAKANLIAVKFGLNK